MLTYRIHYIETGEPWFPGGVEKDYRWMHSANGAQEEINTHHKYLYPVNRFRPSHPIDSDLFMVVTIK